MCRGDSQIYRAIIFCFSRVLCVDEFDNYEELLQRLAQPGAWQGIMTFYATSSALGVPIRSFYPQTELGVPAYSRVVTGRDVRASTSMITIMWTNLSWHETEPFQPNHFVPLIEVGVK